MGMKKRRKSEIGKVKVVKDFLPAPDQLVLREENVGAQGNAQDGIVDERRRRPRSSKKDEYG